MSRVDMSRVALPVPRYQYWKSVLYCDASRQLGTGDSIVLISNTRCRDSNESGTGWICMCDCMCRDKIKCFTSHSVRTGQNHAYRSSHKLN